MKYCISTTKSHPLSLQFPHCLQDLNSLIVSEGFNLDSAIFEENYAVLNLDLVEKEMASIQSRLRNKSMDSAFGLRIDNQQNEFILVEFKFRFTDFKFLKCKDMDGKVQGSTSILGDTVTIHENLIFIFKQGLKQQAKRRLFSMDPKVSSKYLAMDIFDLKKYCFS